MSGVCSVCNDPVDVNQCAVCSVKKCKVHFTCAGITERTWSQQGDKRRSDWKCKSCKGNKGASTSLTGIPTDMINKLHEEYLEKMELTIKEQFKIYTKDLKSEMEDFKKSLNFFSEKIDQYETSMAECLTKVSSAERVNETLIQENRKLANELSDLKSRFEAMDQYNRNKNIQIDGIPEAENESMSDIINKVSAKIQVPINFASDIQAAHRVPTKKRSGVKPIIVQFSNRQKRDLVLSKSKNKSVSLKSVDFVGGVPETNIYINEHLSQFTRELLFEAKQLKEVLGYKYVWVKQGKVMAREDDGSKYVNITSKADVHKLINQAEK